MPKVIAKNKGANSNVVDPILTPHKFFNFKRVIDLTGIQQDKIYNNLKGEYHSLSPSDKKEIAGVLGSAVKSMFEKLGYEVTIKKITAV